MTADTDVRTVYLCPKHGLIEQPSTYDDKLYCPINLSGRDGNDSITDEVCGETVSGPYLASVVR